MWLKSVTIKNFQDFWGESTIYPVYTPEKNVTMIQSMKGDLVDTLYQACCWCAYGGSDIKLNDELAKALTNGQMQRVSVEMVFAHPNGEYRLLRTEDYHGLGDLIHQEGPSVVTVSYRRGEGAEKTLTTSLTDDFLERLRENPPVHFLRYDPDMDLGRILSGQVLLFATQPELQELTERLHDEVELKRDDKRLWDPYACTSKIYTLYSSTRYQIAPLWEDAAMPGGHRLQDQVELPRFSLPGRPALETLFNDHVVDLVRAHGKYSSLGVDFPGPILLHGAPGCGKTYAVERLGEFLNWPRYYIDSATVGSSYVHETGRKIHDLFDQAVSHAPSIVVIDEMDAFLSSRRSGPQSDVHHTEEVAEFLRRIPKAAQDHVLVVGMTNRLDDIDPAFLRRGRFDHIVKVEMPAREEMAAALEALLSKLPMAENVELGTLASALAGRPMSDLAFAIKEAGRLSAKAGRETIGQRALWEAVHALPPGEKDHGQIGFIA